MDYTNLFIGLIATAFGAFTLLMRIQGKTEKFGVLEKMTAKYGEKKANTIHLINYSIVPLVLGIALIVFVLIESK